MIRNILRIIFYRSKHLLHVPIYFLNHAKIDSSNKIAENVSLKYCNIGKYNYIARRNSLFNVEVGNYCCFGPDVHIGGMQHSYWWYSMSPMLSNECKTPEKTIIGNDVWIAAGCIIKQGVKIGNGAVVGANSFVNKDVPPFAIVAGSPAKIIKYRFSNDVIKRIEASDYWSYPPQKAKQIIETLGEIL